MNARDDITARVREIIEAPKPTAAIEKGKPVIGYMCSYIPLEPLLAAGFSPWRMRGHAVEDSSSGDAFMSHLTCSYARHVASAAVDGGFDFLAGQISANTCDHVRRLNDVVKEKSDIGFNGFVSIPRSFRDGLFGWYKSELEALTEALASRFGNRPGRDSLLAAIALMNRVREKLAAIDGLRAADPPLLSGADALAASVAARCLPPEDFIALADELIAACHGSGPLEGVRARVILTGGELDDPRFVDAIESQGAHVAGDLLCFGSRGLGLPVKTEGDLMENVASAYLYQVPCARMMGEFPRRYLELIELFKQRNARGIVFERIKFCQIWSNEVHNLMHRFEDKPVPMLVLDREYGMVSGGQVKTRIQAFLERIAK